MRRVIGWLSLLVVVVAATALALANRGGVTVNLYLARFEVPLALALVSALAVGAVLGVLALLPAILRLKTENLRLRRGLSPRGRAPAGANGKGGAP